MFRIKRGFIQRGAAVAALCVLSLPVLAALAPTAHAAGETFAFVDATHIQMSGDGSGLFAEQLPQIGPDRRFGGVITVASKGNCQINGAVISMAAGATTGVLTARIIPVTTNPGQPAPNLCTNADAAAYNNIAINIGTGGTATETAKQRQITVIVKSPLPPNQNPAQVEIVLLDAAGTPLTSFVNNKQPDGSYLGGSFLNIDPGSYTIQLRGIAGIDPANVTKVRFEPIVVTLGDSFDSQQINVEATGRFGADPCTDHSYGPLPVVLKTKSGTILVTIQTDTISVTASSLCGNGISPTGNELFNLTALFVNISPGDYTVCVASSCGDVTKTPNQSAFIHIDLTPADAALAAAGGPDAVNAPKCEDKAGFFGSLGCGIIEMVDNALNSFLDGIENLLSVDRLYNDKNGSIYKVWASVRSIALIILVPVLLLMVIGTALDFGPFDPYTVKRALPRLIYAAIFIVVSWQVCTFFIDLADIVGGGVQGLILSSVPPDKQQLTGLLTASEGIFMGVIMGTAVIGTATVALAAGIFVVISLALSFLLAILVGYFTLIFRQVILLGLLIISPLAILSWIFPGNDKLWGFWKNAFIGLLVVYPVISGIIGLGKLMAYIVSLT